MKNSSLMPTPQLIELLGEQDADKIKLILTGDE